MCVCASVCVEKKGKKKGGGGWSGKFIGHICWEVDERLELERDEERRTDRKREFVCVSA